MHSPVIAHPKRLHLGILVSLALVLSLGLLWAPIVSQAQANIGSVLLVRGLLPDALCNDTPHQIAVNGAVISCLNSPDRLHTAIDWLKLGPSLGVESWRTYYKLGIAYWALDMPAAAETALDAAVRQKPDSRLVRITRGNLWFATGRSAQAIQEWRSVGSMGGVNRMASIYLQFPELHPTALTYLQVVATNGDPADAGEAFYFLGKYHWEKGDLESAVADFQRAVELRPSHTKYYYTLASTLQELRWFEEATAVLQAALAIEDEAWTAALYAKLGDEYIYSDRLSEALQAYEQAVALKPDDPFFRTRLGWLYRRDGDLRKSLQQLTIAVRIGTAEERAKAYFELAYTYEALHQYGEAEAALEMATVLLPTSTRYYSELGRVRLRLGKQVEALQAYQMAVVLDPNEPEYRRQLDAILTQQSK